MGVTGPRDGVRGPPHRPRPARGRSSSALLVERMTPGREPFGLRAAAARGRAPRPTWSCRPRGRVGGRAPTARRAAPHNSCFAGRTLSGRVLMTVAAGRVAYRQRSFAMGVAAMSAREARPASARRAGRDRRPGGASARRCRTSTQVAQATATLVRGREAIGIPIVVTEQYPKGLGETVPEVAEHLPDGRRADREDRLLRRRGRRLRPRRPRPGARLRDRDPRLRQPDRPRPARPRASRSTSPRDAVGSRTDAEPRLGLHKMERAGAVLTSVETALFELLGGAGRRRVQGGPEADPGVRSRSRVERGYVLLEDGTRFDGELCGGGRTRRPARSSSTPR